MIEIRVGVIFEIHLLGRGSMDLIAIFSEAKVHVAVDLVEDFLLGVELCSSLP